MIQLQFKDFLSDRCLGGWVGKAVTILIQWWLLLWVQIPLDAAFFVLFKTLDVNFVRKCQICVENEKPDSVDSIEFNSEKLEYITQIKTKQGKVDRYSGFHD